jgi:hypothetical protein
MASAIWLKSRILRDSIFPDTVDSALQFVTAGVIDWSKGGLTARQQRVLGLNIKDYFYVIDLEKLPALYGGKTKN